VKERERRGEGRGEGAGERESGRGRTGEGEGEGGEGREKCPVSGLILSVSSCAVEENTPKKDQYKRQSNRKLHTTTMIVIFTQNNYLHCELVAKRGWGCLQMEGDRYTQSGTLEEFHLANINSGLQVDPCPII